jgi:hypothetical protein
LCKNDYKNDVWRDKMNYYGEATCVATKANGLACVNKAYYIQSDVLCCGVHSDKNKRQPLPENPDKDLNRARLLKTRQLIVEQTAQKNRQEGKMGAVVVSKLRMMKDPDHIDGYLKVFPNFKHQHRNDGFGCTSLSPKAIGPIDHGQPNLPIALNLENLHQSNKCFPSEIGENGNPTLEFYETQKKMYNDSIPHRHKEQALSKNNLSGGNKNIPVYSVWILPDGKEIHLGYFESREIYCTFYEMYTKNNTDLLKLKQMLRDGYNLQIIGYDAYPVDKSLDICYKDTSKPFGHELVLYTLLTQDPPNYPWKHHNPSILKH